MVTTLKDLTLPNDHSISRTNSNRNLLKRPAEDDMEMIATQAENRTNRRPRIIGPPTPPTHPTLSPATENLILEPPPTDTEDSFGQIAIFKVDDYEDIVFTGAVPEA